MPLQPSTLHPASHPPSPFNYRGILLSPPASPPPCPHLLYHLSRRTQNLPSINTHPPTARRQDTHSHDAVQPIILCAARLEGDPQVHLAVLLGRPVGLDEDVGAVVREKLVARVDVDAAA